MKSGGGNRKRQTTSQVNVTRKHTPNESVFTDRVRKQIIYFYAKFQSPTISMVHLKSTESTQSVQCA